MDSLFYELLESVFMKFSPKKSVYARTLTSLTALAMFVALTGCSNTDDAAPDLEETTDASDSDPTEYIPASAEGPAENVPEPNLPALGTEKSEEGAKVTLEYFWNALDFARLTGDTNALSFVSHESCELCADHIFGWGDRYSEGEWAVLHGEIEVEVDNVEMHVDEIRNDEWAEISFVLTEPAADLYVSGALDKNESFDEETEATWLADLSYDGSAQRWQVEWLGLLGDDEESPQ